MILAVTGHRPDKLGGYCLDNRFNRRVNEEIRKALLELKPSQCITGMALGVDQFFAEQCINLKIPFIAAIPCERQELLWPESAQNKYREILKQAQSQFVVSPGLYTPACMQIRNQWMVNRCNKLLAIWNGSKGGTANCIAYAEKKIGKENIINIWRKI